MSDDLKSGPLQYVLNCADNADGPACGEEARELLFAHRWELHDALDAIESLKTELGIFSHSTRDAARIIPRMVHEIRQGTVNGSLLLRAIQAEEALVAGGKGKREIRYRGSVTDLATDVAYELTPAQGRELIGELQRFVASEPSKFQAAAQVKKP